MYWFFLRKSSAWGNGITGAFETGSRERKVEACIREWQLLTQPVKSCG